MPKHKYSYPFFEPPGRFPRPYLPIRITNPLSRKQITWDCLIDTGADTCLFPRSLAEMVGHNLSGKGVKSSITCGVEGSAIRTWRHTFRLELMHPTDGKRSVWRSPRVLVECVEHDAFPPLLGVLDFLRHFRLTIDYKTGITTVQW